MNQDQFNEIVNTAAMLAAEDTTNDFYTILEEMIEDTEQKLNTMLEFDEGIAVDSVEELKTEYETEHDSIMVTFVDKW